MKVIRYVFNYKSKSRRQRIEVKNTLVLLASSEVWPPEFLSCNTWETQSFTCVHTNTPHMHMYSVHQNFRLLLAHKKRKKQARMTPVHYDTAAYLQQCSGWPGKCRTAPLECLHPRKCFQDQDWFHPPLLLPIKELNWQSGLPICFSCPLCAAKWSSGNPVWNSLCFLKGLTRQSLCKVI